MSWEQRARGGRYYTRSKREGGRVVREYVGTGPVAELAAAQDAELRDAHRQQLKERRAEREHFQAAEDRLVEFCALADALARGALLLAGYHQHDRGQWRRKREHADDIRA